MVRRWLLLLQPTSSRSISRCPSESPCVGTKHGTCQTVQTCGVVAGAIKPASGNFLPLQYAIYELDSEEDSFSFQSNTFKDILIMDMPVNVPVDHPEADTEWYVYTSCFSRGR